MHEPVRDKLEEYLNRRGGTEMPGEMAAHLQACSSCARELEQIERQAGMLRSLRARRCEPGPGFYARVRERIDQTDDSIWSILLRPALGRRLVIAAYALLLLLGFYLIAFQPDDSAAAAPEIKREVTLPQQRDAVLASLASYHE